MCRVRVYACVRARPETEDTLHLQMKTGIYGHSR